MKLKNILGQKFGLLTVIAYAGIRVLPCGSRVNYWKVRCECGKELERKSTHLLNRKIKNPQSCGCAIAAQASNRFKVHGLKSNRLYGIWSGMMRRCYNSKDKFFKDYGGRGIVVCERWHDVRNFCSDMNGIILPGYSLDRIDNNGSYCLENCRAATNVMQQQNKRTTVNLTFNEETKCMSEWSRELGIPIVTIHHRLRYGWPIDRVLSVKNNHSKGSL